jgi:hypothetical protein
MLKGNAYATTRHLVTHRFDRNGRMLLCQILSCLFAPCAPVNTQVSSLLDSLPETFGGDNP